MTGLDRIIKLLTGVVIILILLTICITVDSADDNVVNETITVEELNVTINETEVNDTYVAQSSEQIITDGKIYSEGPLITITSKPSCGCNHGYYWHKRTFENYCPNCHRYGTLHNAHKRGSQYERELTCYHCDSDFCGVCGKEKYSWSRVRLTPKAKGVTYVGKWSVIG